MENRKKVNSVISTRATASLEEEVEKELKVEDPQLEQAVAKLKENEDDSTVRSNE